MGRAYTLLLQMMRVGAASFVALCVDVTIYTSLLKVFSLAAPAAFLGHVAGILVHFAASSLFFLRSEMSDVRGAARQAGALAKFFVAGGCGLLVTTVVIYVTVDRLGLHPHAGKAVAVGLSFLAVFTALKLLVLRDRPGEKNADPLSAAVGGDAVLNSKA